MTQLAPRSAATRHGVLTLLPLLLALSACGGGSSTGPTVMPALAAPTISQAPGSVSMPMGLTASFSVTASGDALQYQWQKNGVAIPGATAASYTSPALAFTDSGAQYTVTVSNSGGSATSSAATLTVTARAPMAGDLRFQQVDAPSTINGYGNAGGLGSGVATFLSTSFGSAIGTPLAVGLASCAAVNDCGWGYVTYTVPTTANVDGVTAAFGVDSYANFMQDLSTPGALTVGTGITPAQSNAVITSLDLQAPYQAFALSWLQSSRNSGFIPQLHYVTPSGLQAALTAAAQAGQVVTAISNDQGQAVFVAYAWTQDTSTRYEASVLTAPIANVASAASSLAAQGYIITAIGALDTSGTYAVVGTRVQGDTLPRPFMASQTPSGIDALHQQGYATVAYLQVPPSGTTVFLGER